MSSRIHNIRRRIRTSIRRGGGEAAIWMNAPTGYKATGTCSGNKKDALFFRKGIAGKVKVKRIRIEWGGKKRGAIWCLYRKGK